MRSEIFVGPIPQGKSWHQQMPNPEFDKIFEQVTHLNGGASLRIECADAKEANKLCSGLRHRSKKAGVPVKSLIRGKDVYAYLDK